MISASSANLLNKTAIWQITEDHSLLNEEIRAGRLAAGQVSTYQFKNVITRSVGYESRVAVDIYRRKVKPNDLYLAQAKKPEESSGLWDYVKIIGTVPGDLAFRSLADGGCPLAQK